MVGKEELKKKIAESIDKCSNIKDKIAFLECLTDMLVDIISQIDK